MNMRKYGGSLMQRLPNETTQLLKRLCTDYRPDGAPLITTTRGLEDGEEEDGDSSEEEAKAADAEHFLHLFVSNSAQMVDFLEYMIRERPEEASGGVYNTLLEHYLHQYSDPASTANLRKAMEEKAMRVLKRSMQDSDEDQALILCQRHSFSQGALFLYERRGLFSEVLNHHVSLGDVSAAVQTCRRFGDRQPDLWVRALQFIAREGEAEPEQIEEVLESVEKHRLLSPMLIVAALSKSPAATMKLVRGYLTRLMETEDARSSEDLDVVAKYAEETARIREENRKLRAEAVVFQVWLGKKFQQSSKKTGKLIFAIVHYSAGIDLCCVPASLGTSFCALSVRALVPRALLSELLRGGGRVPGLPVGKQEDLGHCQVSTG